MNDNTPVTSLADARKRRERNAHWKAVAQRIKAAHMVQDYCTYLLNEGFEADDIIDALFEAAYRRIDNHAVYLDWAAEVGRLEEELGKE
jgi:hypothetical protein